MRYLLLWVGIVCLWYGGYLSGQVEERKDWCRYNYEKHVDVEKCRTIPDWVEKKK